MLRTRLLIWVGILIACLVCAISTGGGLAQEPIVRAVLFYSPSCPHCHLVMTENLPPLVEKYGDRLQILAINTYTEGGQALFESAIQTYQIEYVGVPLLIVADQVLIGSRDIPELFPTLVEEYMASGGVDWPDFPGMAEAIASLPTQPPEPTTVPETATPDDREAALTPSAVMSSQLLNPTATAFSPVETPLPSGLINHQKPNPSLLARLQHDLVGNLLSILVLIGMIILVLYTIPLFFRFLTSSETGARSWIFALLALTGLAVAAYLAWIETQQLEAVCGPIGDCNTVQQSRYARLFNLMPIGVLGAVGYCLILVAWFAARLNRGAWAQWGVIALRLMTFFGTLFSIYLTFLEPFVIGATCAWCLSSAIIMTALYWMTFKPLKRTQTIPSFSPR